MTDFNDFYNEKPDFENVNIFESRMNNIIDELLNIN